MSKIVDSSQQCTFSSPIDLTAALDQLGIQFLDVDEHRTFVIFAGSILNLESCEGTLTDLKRAEIAVYDLPLHHDESTTSETEAAVELIEEFKDQLSQTTPIR